MKTHSDNELSSMITRRFRRWGQSGVNTGLLNDLSESHKTFLFDASQLAEGELAVAISHCSDSNWTVLTSRRLLGLDNGQAYDIDWNDIVDIRSNYKLPDRMEDLELSRSRVDTLFVDSNKGATIAIQAEAGPPLIGLWNALRLAQQLGGTVVP